MRVSSTRNAAIDTVKNRRLCDFRQPQLIFGALEAQLESL